MPRRLTPATAEKNVKESNEMGLLTPSACAIAPKEKAFPVNCTKPRDVAAKSTGNTLGWAT